MMSLLRLLRDFILGQTILALMALFFAMPIILYVTIFSKFTPDWAAGIVIIALIIGFTVTCEKLQNHQIKKSINNARLGKNSELIEFSQEKINQSKVKAVDWANRKFEELETMRGSISENEYQKIKALINFKLRERINLLDSMLSNKRQQYFFFSYGAAGIVIIFFLWLQPWETPYKKVSDEWSRCNAKFNGKCSYIGKKYQTNSFEMTISEAIYGQVVDIDCYRSRRAEQCF